MGDLQAFLHIRFKSYLPKTPTWHFYLRIRHDVFV